MFAGWQHWDNESMSMAEGAKLGKGMFENDCRGVYNFIGNIIGL